METTEKSLTTTTLVAQHLNLKDENGDILEPEVLKLIVNQVSGLIERYCNRSFLHASYTEDIYDTDIVQVHALPIDRSVPVQIADEEGNFGKYTGSIEHSQAGIVKVNKKVDVGRIVYTGGYRIDFSHPNDETLHTLPFEITGLATQLSARVYEKRFSEGKSNESVEGQSISWSQFLTSEDKALLDTYLVY